jgi:hypothetical protein
VEIGRLEGEIEGIAIGNFRGLRTISGGARRLRSQRPVVLTSMEFHVPAWLVRREINWSEELPFCKVAIRSASEPFVVNLPEDSWE